MYRFLRCCIKGCCFLLFNYCIFLFFFAYTCFLNFVVSFFTSFITFYSFAIFLITIVALAFSFPRRLSSFRKFHINNERGDKLNRNCSGCLYRGINNFFNGVSVFLNSSPNGFTSSF